MLNKVFLAGFRSLFKMIEILAPPLGKRWGKRLFFTPRKFKRPEREKKILEKTRAQRIKLENVPYYHNPSGEYIMYGWGQGPTVLLIHGWEGRGSQLMYFIKPLLKAGYQVVTFDAFAHGASSGKQTNLLEFVHIVKDIEKRVGGFYAIIGHSLGGMAAAFALKEGVETEKLVLISSPASMEFIFDSFERQINASSKISDHIVQFIERIGGKVRDEFSTGNNLVGLQLPGLIIHDRDDKEIPYTQALSLAQFWPNGELVLTKGLGHNRILRDQQMISTVLDYIGLYRERETVDYQAIFIS